MTRATDDGDIKFDEKITLKSILKGTGYEDVLGYI
jgi:hypothetical protein